MSEKEARVAALLAAHGPLLRRVARRVSLCEEDAEDALQRSLEIYVRRLASVERATELAWMKVVVRHEALAIRRSRGETVAREEMDLDARADAGVRALDDRIAARERSARSAEALLGLKHDEALALLLKAEGHSYAEIAASQGWTYTKVNRAITEGRARFLKGFRAIEEGEACERLAPVLAALAGGTATAAQLRDARPHLRHCARCRASLRALHAPLRRRVAALLPLGGMVMPAQWLRERLGQTMTPGSESGVRLRERLEEAAGPRPERAARLREVRVRDVEDAVARLPDAVQHAERVGGTRVPTPRGALHALVHRIAGSDLVTSVQLATGTGGGRTAAVAALIGVCVSSVGAGGYCVATALLPDAPPAKRAPAATSRTTAAHHQRRAAAEPPLLSATTTPVATRSPPREPARARPRRSASRSSAASQQQREFSFESSAGSAGATPAGPTPATVTAASAGAGSSGGGGGSPYGGGSSADGSAAAATSGGEFLP